MNNEKILAHVRMFVLREKLLCPGEPLHLAAAVSGGADSMALLRILLALQPEFGFVLSACHVNHGLRGESADRDEAFVRAECARLGVPLRVFHAAEMADEVGLPSEHAGEDWARRLRYACFARLCGEGIDDVATAHTANDQAETLLLRLARGTGLHGAAGIRPKRGCYLRPLLALTRQDTESFCRAAGQAWVTDETNATDAYARNRVRRAALPALQSTNGAAVENLARFCEKAARADAYFARKAEELLSAARLDAAQAAIKSPEACTVWRLGPLSAADALILEAAMHSLTAPVRDAEEKYVQLLCGLVRRGSGAVQLTPDACWTAANGILYCRSVLKMQPEAIPAPHQLLKTGVYCLPGGYELEIQQLNYEVFLKNPSFLKKDYTYCADYAKINKNIFVRTRQPGDTFRPAGRHVGKTLKKYLNEAKVPVAERTLMPLLACGSQVLWLWGAGFADGLSPDDGTKQILLIRQSRQPAAPEQEQDHNIGGTDHA